MNYIQIQSISFNECLYLQSNIHSKTTTCLYFTCSLHKQPIRNNILWLKIGENCFILDV